MEDTQRMTTIINGRHVWPVKSFSVTGFIGQKLTLYTIILLLVSIRMDIILIIIIRGTFQSQR